MLWINKMFQVVLGLPRETSDIDLQPHHQSQQDKLHPSWYVTCIKDASGGSVGGVFAPWVGGRGLEPLPRHTKDVKKWY